MEEKGVVNVEEAEPEEEAFVKSEKASAAAQVNLSAKLSKDGSGSGQKGSMSEIWRLLKIARPELGSLSWAFLFLLISSAVSMSVPFSIGKILDIATQAEGSNEMLFGLDITTFYVALATVLATGAAANFGRIIILRIVGERIVARLRSQLYRKTFIQNAEFFDANRVGDLISRLGSDTIIVGKSITQNLSDGLRSGVSGAAGFVMMGWVSLKLTGILALIGPPIAIVAFVSGRALRNISRKIQKNLGTLTKIAEERLGNVRTSQAFAGEVQEAARYNRQVKRIFQLGKKEAIVAASFFGSTGLLGNLTIIAVLYAGGGMVKSGAISIGELTSFLMYTAYAGSSMVGLSGFWGEMMKGVGAASRLFELQDRNPTISPTKGEPVRSARGPIEFKNVTFSYPTRPKVTIFKDLNFKINQGINVAIVAPSGAGKSTVASLLLRFYIPTEGTITIDGRDITKLNAKQLRRKIGFVGQEPVLFSGTIAENIAYGVPQATRAEIVAAARKANCQFISDFPDGLETHVGARGTQLSGGQKQRIAIARALIKQPDILILDEATSALDAESETLVNQALGKLLEEKNTTISIAHRLSTIKRSDRIIVISNDGQVAEEGTYSELASRPDGAFSKLMEWQLNGGDVQPTREPRIMEEEEIENDLEQKFKMAGNRENKPPKHEMVHFAGLLNKERKFGDFRTVLHTGLFSQLVAMEVPVNGEIGDEVHTVDQILLFTGGKGLATVAGKDQEVQAGDVVVVPAGTQHQFVTRGDKPLELITVYSPAEHDPRTVHKTKEEGDEEEDNGKDEAPEWSHKTVKENVAAGLINESGKYD
ncbi:P-loop containing nucleoside triphosphate hydrolase protein [Aaosphaeria arxii CBS 175.79]|uniref:P-loop containing nucleoside triphosphate hydrolase protein n=1 Tax=Aaosphaeria arxii CBS 175.79 TaxID=1450172 RepID=A0A6A5Y4I2_9PLEO|nr:P-loop containing nucleoside triphosphate hydrolase protein [Aaosphaeria arxii CBS 175.79]KAF2019791.1 P-loop containing nucleoside triphosphate hydrolase protein [Aaosphaeria arxii CBS 175.79]